MAEDTDSQSGIVTKQESKDSASRESPFHAEARRSGPKGKNLRENNSQFPENPVPDLSDIREDPKYDHTKKISNSIKPDSNKSKMF